MVATKFSQCLWLMPAAYAVHIVEEYVAGFPSWVSAHMHATLGSTEFLVNNAVFMSILVSLALWASRSRSAISAFVFICWASGNLFWNFVFHLLTTVYFDSYSPGLVSAVLLYFPVSILAAVLVVREGRLSCGSTVGAFAIGAGAMLFVIWAGLWKFQISA